MLLRRLAFLSVSLLPFGLAPSAHANPSADWMDSAKAWIYQFSCEGSCGGQAGFIGCWCDEACVENGDCCLDYQDHCATPSSCSGTEDCGTDQYCHIDLIHECSSENRGVCKPKPKSCSAEKSPVCGCDGKDYDNLCKAHQNGTSQSGRGNCRPGACKNWFESGECGPKHYCEFNNDGRCGYSGFRGSCRPRLETCTNETNYVCGCDVKTYKNPCEAQAAGVAQELSERR